MQHIPKTSHFFGEPVRNMMIRPARRSDLEQIAGIHVASWRSEYEDVLPADFLDQQIGRVFERHWQEVTIQKDDVVLVAKDDTIMGFIAVWCRPGPFIDNLHVTASHRSKGVGAALMAAAAEILIQRGHQNAYLWVFESNRKAIRFYERLGGVQKETDIKSIYGYDVLSRKIEWADLNVIGKAQLV